MQQLKVIWQEGMLLRPQHFQQSDRYHAQQLQTRTRRLGEPAWGFFELNLDRQFLAMGKVVVNQASGILPDGSLFELGAEGEPLALDVPATTRDSAVWLALPLSSGQRVESRSLDQDDVIARYLSIDSEIVDSHAGFGETGAVSCGRPDFRLLLDDHPRLDAYVRLQVCQLLETAPDGSLELDTSFSPSVIQVRAAEDLHVLKERLAASLRLFEQRALADGLDSGEVMAARYALCTTVDEAVVTTPWGNAGDWSQFSLLSSFHNETFGGEKFFLLLERLSRNPAKHLALLELLYLCLALGFEGKYRVLPRGMVELEAIRDGLYRQLRQLRGDVPRELSPHWQGLDARPRRLIRLVPWWLVGLFTLICLSSLYGGFRLVLEQQRDGLLEGYPGRPAVAAPAALPSTI